MYLVWWKRNHTYMRETLPNKTRRKLLVFMKYAQLKGEHRFPLNWNTNVVNSLKMVNEENINENTKQIYIQHKQQSYHHQRSIWIHPNPLHQMIYPIMWTVICFQRYLHQQYIHSLLHYSLIYDAIHQSYELIPQTDFSFVDKQDIPSYNENSTTFKYKLIHTFDNILIILKSFIESFRYIQSDRSIWPRLWRAKSISSSSGILERIYYQQHHSTILIHQ